MQDRFENSIFRSKRDFKLADQIRKDLATILHQKIRDPRLINVTIIDVEISRDLRVAKIFYSVYPWSDKVLNEVDEGFKAAKSFFRAKLSSQLKLYKVPELIFCLDKSLHVGNRISQLLSDSKKK